MLIDITWQITPEIAKAAPQTTDSSLAGSLPESRINLYGSAKCKQPIKKNKERSYAAAGIFG